MPTKSLIAYANVAKRFDDGRVVAVDNVSLTVAEGETIGKVTSGGFGPSVNGPVAMGYVDTKYAAPGTALNLMVRGKALPAQVVVLPFVPHRYVRI